MSGTSTIKVPFFFGRDSEGNVSYQTSNISLRIPLLINYKPVLFGSGLIVILMMSMPRITIQFIAERLQMTKLPTVMASPSLVFPFLLFSPLMLEHMM